MNKILLIESSNFQMTVVPAVRSRPNSSLGIESQDTVILTGSTGSRSAIQLKLKILVCSCTNTIIY